MNITYIRAPKDVNDNPRRGWLIETPKGFVFLNEGYAGYSVLYEWLGSASPLCDCGQCPVIWYLGSEIFSLYVDEHWQDVSAKAYNAYKQAHS